MAAVISSSSLYTPARNYSMRSSVRFFYLVDDIGRLFSPTDTQLRDLESSYKGTGLFVANSNEFGGLLEEIHAHGSRQLGTLVRPRDEDRDGFDIDLIARLKHSAKDKYCDSNGPKRLLNDLAVVLNRYAEAHGLRLHRWDRCVTLEYAGGMTADIVPVIDDPSQTGLYGDTRGKIPDEKNSRFDYTNPRGYAKWFSKAAGIQANFTRTVALNDSIAIEGRAEIEPLPPAQEVFDRLLCRLVQLFKLHRNVAFVGDALKELKPSSTFITTLASNSYTKLAPKPHDSPLELMLHMIEDLPNHFSRFQGSGLKEHWVLENPVAPDENLAGSMDTQAKQEAFRQWARKMRLDVSSIIDAIEENKGMDVLLRRLEAAFGPRAATAIRDDRARKQQAFRSASRVAVFSGIGTAVSAPVRAHNFYGS